VWPVPPGVFAPDLVSAGPTQGVAQSLVGVGRGEATFGETGHIKQEVAIIVAVAVVADSDGEYPHTAGLCLLYKARQTVGTHVCRSIRDDDHVAACGPGPAKLVQR